MGLAGYFSIRTLRETKLMNLRIQLTSQKTIELCSVAMMPHITPKQRAIIYYSCLVVPAAFIHKFTGVQIALLPFSR